MSNGKIQVLSAFLAIFLMSILIDPIESALIHSI